MQRYHDVDCTDVVLSYDDCEDDGEDGGDDRPDCHGDYEYDNLYQFSEKLS